MNTVPSHQLLASYWGKADPNAATPLDDHHTVVGHSLDVAACAFTIIGRNPVLLRQLTRATGLPSETVALTVSAVCALHDVGKLDTRFQRKAPHIADRLRPHTAAIHENKYDHGTEGFRLIEDDANASEHLHSLLGAHALYLLRAVAGHHGALPTRDLPDSGRTRLPRQIRKEDELARRQFCETVVGFFSALGAELPWSGIVTGALVQRLAGLCAIADWLGSNVEYFPYTQGVLVDLEPYWDGARERASRACSHAGLIRATPAPLAFESLFPGYAARDVQVLTELVSSDEPALIVVEAEMGKGKTEAALSVAARFLAAGYGDGITISLPTMATSNAMFARVEDIVERLFPSQPLQLALAHGRAQRHPGFQAVISRALNDPDATEASVACSRWLLNKKRILLAQVGVGTIDQALQAGLIVRHQFVRMFGLSRNVVIIDEVHAYDAYMEVLLEHLVNWLGALEVPVILLSATLPSERRAALARSWRAGARGATPEESGSPTSDDTLSVATACAYPLVTVTTRGGSSTLASDLAAPQRTILIEHAPTDPDDEAHTRSTAALLVAAAQEGGRVVWIRNTVGEAQRAYRAVEELSEGVEHLLFHARFRGCDRTRIENRVLARFGKAAPPGGRILIATQVVEQSLDLDFDEMHSDLAPIDLLFQRVGRLHRHMRPRPPRFERPRLVVHGPDETAASALRFGPSHYVYDDGTLFIASRALRSRRSVQLPQDIRPLVEQTYHPESRAALLALGGEALVATEAKREGLLRAKRTKARRCCIEPSRVEPSGESMLDDDDEQIQALTRDGKSATLLPFVWAFDGGRVIGAGPDSPPWKLKADGGAAWELASTLLDQTVSIPVQGDVEEVVSAAQADAWNTWRAAFARFAEDSGLGKRVVPLPMGRDRDGYTGSLRMWGKVQRFRYDQSHGLTKLDAHGEGQGQ
jgi:CRISPR-associated endonuclease/helicase Cas3